MRVYKFVHNLKMIIIDLHRNHYIMSLFILKINGFELLILHMLRSYAGILFTRSMKLAHALYHVGECTKYSVSHKHVQRLIFSQFFDISSDKPKFPDSSLYGLPVTKPEAIQYWYCMSICTIHSLEPHNPL